MRGAVATQHPPWSPATIPGLTTWYDAGVNFSPGGVWNPVSTGLGPNLTPPGYGALPQASTIGTGPAVQFLGMTDCILRGSTGGDDLRVNRPFTFLTMVSAMGNPTKSRWGYFTGWGRTLDAQGGARFEVNAGTSPIGPTANGSPHALAFVFHADGTQSIYMDGTFITRAADGGQAWGGDVAFGGTQSDQTPNTAGRIGAFIMATGEIAPADLAAWWSYASTRWGAWTPALLPSLVGWWDADDPATLAVTDNMPRQVVQWNDKSGNANHWAQATSVLQPTLNFLGTPYGRGSLHFAGGQYMDDVSPPGIDPYPAACSAFAVVRFAGSADRTILAEHAQGLGFAWRGNVKMELLVAQAIGLGTSTTNVDAATHVHGVTRTNGAGYAFYRDGVADGSGTHASTWSGSGQYFRLGADIGGSTLVGELCELVYGTAIWSPAEIAALSAYLAEKWLTPIPFTPADLSTLAAWYDASDPTTITAVAGRVSEWRDKSPNALHVTQPTGSKQPVTGASTIGGRNVLDFVKASAYHLSRLSMSTTFLSVFTAVRHAPLVAGASVPATFAGAALFYATDPGLQYINVYAGTGESSANQVTFPANLTASLRMGAGVTPSALTMNGVDKFSYALTYVNPTTQVFLGSDGSDADALQGSIAEVIATSDRVNDHTASKIRAYLHEKWLTPFTPTRLPGLVGWWDASDAATITASAGRVSQWNDKSASGFHLTQATSAEQPLSGSASIGGRNTLSFDFTRGDALGRSGMTTPAVNTGTWFAAVRPLAAANYGRILSFDTGLVDYDNPQSIAAMVRDAATNDLGIYYNGAQRAQRTTTPFTPLVLTTRRNGDVSGAWVNGGAPGAPAGLGTANFAFTRMAVGNTASGWPVGGTGDSPAPMDLGEVIWYSGALSDTDRATVEAYLKAKWGTP
jgi:hypothetical protein